MRLIASGSWQADATFDTSGTYTLFVDAYNESGNTSATGPFIVFVGPFHGRTCRSLPARRNHRFPVRDLSVDNDTVQVVAENQGGVGSRSSYSACDNNAKTYVAFVSTGNSPTLSKVMKRLFLVISVRWQRPVATSRPTPTVSFTFTRFR